jgi:hypothetical protein
MTLPKPRWPLLALAVASSALLLSGCADTVTFQQAATHASVGFWHGLWHGLILPFAWLVSLFDPEVAIYAIYNNRGWYNLGFVLGAGALHRGVRRSK